MTDDNNKRKKKRGRKNNFSCSCFPSLITPTTEHKPFLCHDNNNNNLDAHITTGTKNGRVLIPVDNNDHCIPSPHRPRFSRLVKAVLFGSLMAKKNIHRSSSKSSSMANSDKSGSYITYDKTGDDNNACVRECADTDDTSSRCRSNLLTSSSSSSSSSSGTNCSSNSYSTSSCSSTFSTSRSSSQQKSSSSSQIDLVDFRHPNSSKSFLLDQNVSSRMDHPRHLRHQDSSVSVSLPLANPKPMKSIHKSLSFEKGLSRLDSLDSLSSLSSLNRDKTKCSRNNGNNILWCFFLLLSLVVLVVYGRIFSILCTSTWFYFVPCLRIKRVNSSTNMTAFVDTDSERYKKRIIMAGLLDRTRNPFR